MSDRSTSLKLVLARWLPVAILGGVILVAGLTAVLGWRTAPDRLEVDLSRMSPLEPSTKEAAGTLRVAVASILTPTSNFRAYRKIIEYLGTQLQRPTEMVQRSSYAEVNELLATGGVDLAFVCSGAYVDLRGKGDVELLVVPVVDGSTTYQSWIIVRSGLGARAFEDLLGRTFAFVDPISNTGYYFPMWRVLQLGEDPERFFEATKFTHSHEESIEMVAEGVVDAAAVDHLVFEGLVEQRPELEDRVRVIERSRPFGIPPVVVRKGIDSELRGKLRDLLLGIHRDTAGRQAMASLGFDRFALGRDADYDDIAAMRADLGREIR